MKILADAHHGALTHSFQLLFEKRFGFGLYKPIGLEWWREGFWKVWDAEDTAKQYLDYTQAIKSPLDENGRPLSGFQHFNPDCPVEEGIWYVKDFVYNTIQRGITLEKFKQTKFDIIIASMPQHIGPFIELQQKYQPQAKLIFQAGNAWHPDPRIKNFMGSIAKCPVPPGVNAVFYHQEMDAQDFRYEPPTSESKNKVRSFVHYMSGKPKMDAIAKCLPGWDFTSYGAGMDVNNLSKMSDVGNAMREAGFHCILKSHGDGFGHVAHSAGAVGRVAIFEGKDYKGKLAGDIFLHNKTALDIEILGSAQRTADRMKEIISTDEHQAMCKAMADRFREVIDYDKEEKELRSFINHLI